MKAIWDFLLRLLTWAAIILGLPWGLTFWALGAFRPPPWDPFPDGGTVKGLARFVAVCFVGGLIDAGLLVLGGAGWLVYHLLTR